MAFDIHQLDRTEADDERAEKALDQYCDELVERFQESPEGQTRLQADPEMGFWANGFVEYAFNYLGATPPRVTAAQVEEIVTEILPRKVSSLSPEEADQAIPELIAFWEYLQREYKLSNANAALRVLRRVKPDFRRLMNDPANWGMAKSLVMQGQAAGFDMTSEEGVNQFMAAYNARLLAQPAGPGREFPDPFGRRPGSRPDPKKKKQRKAAKAARKRNRRR